VAFFREDGVFGSAQRESSKSLRSVKRENGKASENLHGREIYLKWTDLLVFAL